MRAEVEVVLQYRATYQRPEPSSIVAIHQHDVLSLGKEFGQARRVLSGPFINVPDRSHDMGFDGRHLLILGPREETTTRLEVITGWMDEVRQKARAQPK